MHQNKVVKKHKSKKIYKSSATFYVVESSQYQQKQIFKNALRFFFERNNTKSATELSKNHEITTLDCQYDLSEKDKKRVAFLSFWHDILAD